MTALPALHIVVGILFATMAFRAFRSASRVDYLLGLVQASGVLLLVLGVYPRIALFLLLVTAFAYLASQIATGARPLSRGLPVAGAVAVAAALWI